MPIRLSDLRRETRPITFEFLGESITITYTPSAFTPELEDEANAAESNHQLNAMASMLSKILTAWDVIGDDGKPLPVTLGLLRAMSAQFLAAILKAIMDDNQPPKESESSFGAPSSAVARSEQFQTGT